MFSSFIPMTFAAMVPMMVQSMVLLNPSASSTTMNEIQSSSFRYSAGYIGSLSNIPGTSNHIVEPDQFDYSMYTHVIYSFLSVNAANNKVTLKDPDRDDEYIRRLIKHVRKNHPGVKVLLSVINLDADYNENEIQPLRSNEELHRARRSISISAVEMVDKYKADGIDLFSDRPMSDNEDPYTRHLVSLVREMRHALAPNYTLSAMIPEGGDWTYSIDALASIAYQLDFVTIMAVDMREKNGNTDSVMQPFNDIQYFKDQIQVAVDAGVPLEKLLLSLQFSSDSYEGEAAIENWSVSTTPYNLPSFRFVEDEVLSYYDISDILANRREGAIPQHHYHDKESFTDVVGFGGKTHRFLKWVTYNGPESITMRVRFSKALGMGGVSVLCIEDDDKNFALSKAVLAGMQ